MLTIRNILIGLLSGFCVVLVGCGSSTTVKTPPPSFANVSGDWTLTANSAISTVQTMELSGIMTGSGAQVSGMFIIPGAACYYTSQNGLLTFATIPFTGTIDSSGNVALKSSAVAGQVISVTGIASTDGSTLTSGSYSVAGGCADSDHGTIAGNRVPSLTGSFSVSTTLNTLGSNPTPVSTPVTIATQFTQGAAGSYSYPFSGTVTVTGTPCFSKGTSMLVSNQPLTGGVVYGRNFGLYFTMDDNSTLIVTGTSDSTGALLNTGFVVKGGKCDGQLASGTLTRQ